MTVTEAARAARIEEPLRVPMARQPNLCGTPPNLYDNVQ